MEILDTRKPQNGSRIISINGHLGDVEGNSFEHPVNSGAVVSVDGTPGLFLLCREGVVNPTSLINGVVRHFLVSLHDGVRLPAGNHNLIPTNALLRVE